MPPAHHRLVRTVAVVLLAVLVLTGCAPRLVRGAASPAPVDVTDVAAADLPVAGAVDDPVDRVARDSLADLTIFWTQQFPAVFGRAFTPLAGGFSSVDPDDADPARYPGGRIGCGELPTAVEGNAFYCPPGDGVVDGDSIQYDRSFLAGLATDHGPFIPALVMAHEFGHAVQARVGYPGTSIAVETQADCFAGAWTRWVAAGSAQHSTIRAPELDEVLRGYLLLRDPVGTSRSVDAAHGSYFDRVSAFQQGFDGGAAGCRDGFGVDRQFTQSAFTRDQDLATGGNAGYAEVVRTFAPQGLAEFWTAAFAALGRAPFRPPVLIPSSRTAPACGGTTADADLSWCPGDRTVRFDERDLTRPLYDEVGDYAVLTALAVPYALAARNQLGRAPTGQAAVRSAVCLAGAFTQAVLDGQVPSTGISPGDVDESVRFLLEHGTEPSVLGSAGLTGFQLVDVFRGGVLGGLPACGVG